MCFLSIALTRVTNVINVGSDDQSIRIKKSVQWPKGRGSQAHILAEYIINYHKKHEKWLKKHMGKGISKPFTY